MTCLCKWSWLINTIRLILLNRQTEGLNVHNPPMKRSDWGIITRIDCLYFAQYGFVHTPVMSFQNGVNTREYGAKSRRKWRKVT